MSIYYIADMHFGHENIIEYDGRPFKNAEEMDKILIKNWNSRVKEEDTVYILGDLFFSGDLDVQKSYLEKLSGHKILVLGNHDDHLRVGSEQFFDKIVDYLEIEDGDRHVILSHYPIPFFKNDYNKDWWMLHGHVHNNTTDAKYLVGLRDQIKRFYSGSIWEPVGNFINVGCMMPWMDYTPRTLDEICGGEG